MTLRGENDWGEEERRWEKHSGVDLQVMVNKNKRNVQSQKMGTGKEASAGQRRGTQKATRKASERKGPSGRKELVWEP